MYASIEEGNIATCYEYDEIELQSIIPANVSSGTKERKSQNRELV